MPRTEDDVADVDASGTAPTARTDDAARPTAAVVDQEHAEIVAYTEAVGRTMRRQNDAFEVRYAAWRAKFDAEEGP